MVFTCQFCEPLTRQWIHLQCYSCSTLPGSEGPCSETEPGQQTLCEPPHNGCAILEGEISISLYSLQWPLSFDLCSWLDFPFDAEIFAETSEDGTLMLRECVENAAESEFKCEMKEGEQGRVSFLLNSNPVLQKGTCPEIFIFPPGIARKGGGGPCPN